MLGCSSRSGRGSCARIRFSRTAEPMKLTLSARTAYGAVIAAIRSPPTPGPPTCAAERETSSLEFPSTSCSRVTIVGRYDWYATSKKTVKTPTANPTT